MSVIEKVKRIAQGAEARKKILAGVNKVADVVASTMGPHGRNVLIDQGEFEPPRITNDGVFVAKKIKLEDELERTAANSIIEVADQTDKKAGDGTTTSIVIAREILKTAFALLGDTRATEALLANSGSIGVMDVYRDIQNTLTDVKKKLKGKKATKQNLTDVAITSLENDVLGKKVAEIVSKVGEDGFVDVIEGFTGEIEYEILEGMDIRGRFTDEYFMLDKGRRETVLNDIPIVITNHKLEAVQDLSVITQALSKQGKEKAVIMAHGFSQIIRHNLLSIVQQSKGKIIYLPVKIPSLLPEEYEDVAVFCDAKVINKDANMLISDFKVEDCGYTNRFVINEDRSVLIGGRGKDNIAERIKILKNEKEREKDRMFKMKIDRRIASLAKGTARVHVAQNTVAQGKYLKLKIEDAVMAVQAAMTEGVVPGGGLALKEIAEELGEDNILHDALMAPYRQIQKNAGGEIEIKDNVLDPVKVVRVALENACSAAGTLITADSIIADKQNYELMGDGAVEGARIVAKALEDKKR